VDYVKDPLTQEIDAMAIIGQLLGKLPDAAARQRVLAWAVERYNSESAAPRAQPAAAAERSAVHELDSTLAVDSLKDIFAVAQSNDDDLAVPALEAIVQAPAKAPVQSILQSFASEFRRFADEWKGAAA
jgi:hypothetical protein